jgi:hypothetical protein
VAKDGAGGRKGWARLRPYWVMESVEGRGLALGQAAEGFESSSVTSCVTVGKSPALCERLSLHL